MKELLICALKRHGKPGTAGDILDMAMSLGMQANWSRNRMPASVKQVSALLKGMVAHGEALKAGSRSENSRDTPMYAPHDCFDPSAPMPAEPAPLAEDHPLHGMSQRQKYVLFDVLDRYLATYIRQRTTVREMLDQQERELTELAAAVKRDLMAAGLEARL
jgi:hypothetical protein